MSALRYWHTHEREAAATVVLLWLSVVIIRSHSDQLLISSSKA
ncbi:hypothetical protein CEV32_4038 [Brucella rhizosphaerae]|uniref:Uncharacterized protein n=1 Tax=Brucella rhizosphaerae TaxID=571254 RepID=A0A256FR07_9HYPH|nr:hypothetical protein CEV32_4038 [Brucella rhizosphaerae]